MRYGSGIGQNGGGMQTVPDLSMRATMGASVKEIPYDYVATFRLEGRLGRRVQDVISISTEGSFIATSIGYSFIPARLPLPSVSVNGNTLLVNNVEVGGEPLNLLVSMALPVPTTTILLGTLAPNDASVQLASIGQSLLARFCGIDFKYSIVDSGTGRELQNQAIHNIAGLGSAGGERPFRPFARPALFLPRSTIRIEVEEVSEGPLYTDAQLFIVLHGYKRLGE
jgi:hypothetical protein